MVDMKSLNLQIINSQQAKWSNKSFLQPFFIMIDKFTAVQTKHVNYNYS